MNGIINVIHLYVGACANLSSSTSELETFKYGLMTLDKNGMASANKILHRMRTVVRFERI